MASNALSNLQAANDEAAKQLAAEIIAELEKHIEACVPQGQMRPFVMKLTTNCDKLTVTKAIGHCALWSKENGNELTEDYLWSDSDQPDLYSQISRWAESGLVGNLLGSVGSGPLMPLRVAMVLIEATINVNKQGKDKEIERTIMFAPSAFRSLMRTPLQVYTVTGGYVSTAVMSVADLATQAAKLGAGAVVQAATLAGQTVGFGIGFAKGLFSKKGE